MMIRSIIILCMIFLSSYSMTQAQFLSQSDLVQTVDTYYDVFDNHIRQHTRFIIVPRLQQMIQRRLWSALQHRLEDVIETLTQKDQMIVFQSLWSKIVLQYNEWISTQDIISHHKLTYEINIWRKNNNLSVLQFDPTLMQVAYRHAIDLYQNFPYDIDEDGVKEILSHTGTDGTRVMQRAIQAGYHYIFIAENLAYNQPFAEQVLIDRENSPTHKANLAAIQPTHMGVAKMWPYWVLVLWTPLVR